jgi:hypothetical protein
MDDLDAAIETADAAYRRIAVAHARSADRLVHLLATRIARTVHRIGAYRDATAVGVDSDHNLDVVATLTAVLADNDDDPRFADLAEQIRDDLLHIAETGRFDADHRLLQLPRTRTPARR